MLECSRQLVSSQPPALSGHRELRHLLLLVRAMGLPWSGVWTLAQLSQVVMEW